MHLLQPLPRCPEHGDEQPGDPWSPKDRKAEALALPCNLQRQCVRIKHGEPCSVRE